MARTDLPGMFPFLPVPGTGPAGTLDRDRTLTWVILLALAVRLAVFFGTMIWPIPNEDSLPVSPLNSPSYLDFTFYLDALERYRTVPLTDILNDFIIFYQRPFEQQFGHIIAGPVFPGLVALFAHKEGATLPFATFFLGLSFATTVLWLCWMAQFRVSKGWLYLFAVAPNPIWFMLVLSPDALFAFLVCVFFLSYFREPWSRMNVVLWVGIVILALLTRPNGYSLLLFALIDMTVRHLLHNRHHLVSVLGVLFLVFVFALYLYPYFITEMRKSIIITYYFDKPSSEYIMGLFSGLPYWLDALVSWSALLGAKLLYFVGLRPTYGDTSTELVVLRASAGVILLPGLVHVAFRLPRRQRLFIVLFCAPIFLGPTQDRYNLPIYPILFLHGALAYELLFRWAGSLRPALWRNGPAGG